MVNGTAAHGEDFDDTFEGGPVHSGAVIVPAVLAACERFGRDGPRGARRHRRGVEMLCRLPGGAEGDTQIRLPSDRRARRDGCRCGVGAALGLKRSRRSMRWASPAAWRAASSNIWPKAHGPSAACGLGGAIGHARGAHGQQGFLGPRTVFEGTHGLFNGFARSTQGDYAALTRDFGASGSSTRSPSSPMRAAP